MANDNTRTSAPDPARSGQAVPVRKAAGRSARFGVLVVGALLLAPAPAIAAETADVPPAKLRQLLDLLNDHEIRGYLERHASPAIPAPAEPVPAAQSWYAASSAAVGQYLAEAREHVVGLVGTVPRLPDEFERARDIFSVEYEDRGLYSIGGYFLMFVGLGALAEVLFHRLMRPARAWLGGLRLDTVSERVRAVFARFAYGLGTILAFTLGSIGAFLLIDWPPLLREILLGYLFAQFVVRLVVAVGRLLLAPAEERFRVVPMDTVAARFLLRRLTLIAGLAAFGEVTISLLVTFGFSPESRGLLELGLAVLVLLIGLEIVWRCPPRRAAMVIDGSLQARARMGNVVQWMISGYLVLLCLLWDSQSSSLFWLAAFAVGMPVAIRLTEQSVDHVLRPPGAFDFTGPEARSIEAVVLERGARSAIIVLGALFLAHVWGIDFAALTSNDAWVMRLARGALAAVVIGLIAEFIWHVASVMFDRRLTTARPGERSGEADRKAARLRTLLPILKNLVFVLILVLALMMILSALGFEIGPLIASAGVIGVAIGFGAQTLVRDIISGVFYLLDDAFRVGEYIQSGSFKGTVESFSLRSVKLRHHRGALFTVPFGVLGAVQNLSRDWVIEKITIGVSYKTDLAQVRKIIKSIGTQIAADPELAGDILSPLKMQGVDNFADYAMNIRLKMMTKPGDAQFTARRRALEMIKSAFDANDIQFAQPTLQVSTLAEAVAEDDAAGNPALMRRAPSVRGMA